MKKCLLACSLCFFPISFYTYADMPSADFAPEYKFSLLEAAEDHRQKALNALSEVENMCYYLPDLGKKEHMRALIASAATTPAIPDIRAKILAVGLALIGSLSVDAYDTYCEFRMHLVTAVHHFELANFYNRLSLKLSNLSDDTGTRAFLLAIDCLTFCDILAYLIDEETNMGDDLATEVMNTIREYKNYFIKEFQKSKGKLTKQLSKDAWMLYENLDEMLSETDVENEIKGKISFNVLESVRNLRVAEKYWGIYQYDPDIPLSCFSRSLRNQHKITKRQFQEYCEAIDYIDDAFKLAQTMNDTTAKFTILKELEACKNRLQSDCLKKDFSIMSNEAIILNNNMHGIGDLGNKFHQNLHEIERHLKMAEKM